MQGSPERMLRALLRGDFEAVDRYVYEVEWESATGLLHGALWLAANRRFTPYSRQEIAEYVAEVRRRYDALDTDVAEALIRAACGEEHLADGLRPDSALPVEMVLVHELATEQAPTEEQLDAFMSETMALVRDSST